MYFAMDEIGRENDQNLRKLDKVEQKWAFLERIAQEYGFEGIHITPGLYRVWAWIPGRYPTASAPSG